jgi:hypothetical protein
MPQDPVRPALHRRRVLLAWLLAAAIASLVLAVVAQRPQVWTLQAAADTLLAGYLGMLIHWRNAAAGHEMARHGLRS